MMDKDFDFNDIGKTTPYRTPDNFFDDMQDKIVDKVIKKNRRGYKLRIAFASLLAAAVVAGLVFFVGGSVNEPLPASSGQVTAKISDTVTNDKQMALSDKKSVEPTKGLRRVAKADNKQCVNTQDVDNVDNVDEDWIEQLSDEDLSSLMALSDNDVFYN